MTKDDIKRLIEAGLPTAQVTVTGDDGQHFEAEVVYGYGARGVVDTKLVKLDDLKKAIEQAGYKPTLPQT